jgi:transmembrane sensor
MEKEKRETIKFLFSRYCNQLCTRDEYDQFLSLIAAAENDEDLHGLLDELWLEIGEREYQEAGTKQQGKEAGKFALWPRIAAAASIILALSFGGYILLHKPKPQQTAQNQKQDIAPGHNQATLTLANGKKIILTQSLNGQLATLGATLVNANGGNAITYTADQKGSPLTSRGDLEGAGVNTLSTARGEQSPYPLILVDGTKVWLNAASSIIFPTAFNGHDRTVKITGEVYFEVVHHAAQPFKVTVNGQTIEDVGTHFDINAYNDEPVMKTTVLEGSVKLSVGSATQILKSGQQAQVKAGSIALIPDADTEEAIAWHKGLFQFDYADIPAVMRQLSRWYDVDIAYEGKPANRHFSGKIYRDISALKVSDILNYSGIHFRIEGKKIIVEP